MHKLAVPALLALALSACNPPTTNPTVNAATAIVTSAPGQIQPTLAPGSTQAPAAATPFTSPNSPTGRQPDREGVTLAAGNFVPLTGFYYSAPTLRAPAVLLLSPTDGDAQSWDAFARRLQAIGVASLAVAPQSKDSPSAAIQAQIALKWLQGRAELDADRVGLVAAGGGAAAAVQVGEETPAAKALLLLSPDLGTQSTDQVTKRFGRPTLVVGERDILDGSVGVWLVRALG